MAFHITSEGETGKCRAKQGKCPFTATPHFDTEEKAREYYETKVAPKPRKLKKVRDTDNGKRYSTAEAWMEDHESMPVGMQLYDTHQYEIAPVGTRIEIGGYRYKKIDNDWQRSGQQVRLYTAEELIKGIGTATVVDDGFEHPAGSRAGIEERQLAS